MVLAAKSLLTEPFVVINADDYYEKNALKQMHEFLLSYRPASLRRTEGMCTQRNCFLTGVRTVRVWRGVLLFWLFKILMGKRWWIVRRRWEISGVRGTVGAGFCFVQWLEKTNFILWKKKE